MSQAAALLQADTIRAYVVTARDANMALRQPAPEEAFDAWAVWALAQADRIDPVLNGEFLDTEAEIADV